MSTVEQDGDAAPSWLAFARKMEPAARKPPKARTPRGRAAYERDGMVPDGRSARRTGRDVKMTLKVRPEFKAKLAAMAAARDTGMAEILELALDKLEGGRG
jgi:hypothetical protein